MSGRRLPNNSVDRIKNHNKKLITMKREITWPNCNQKDAEKVFRVLESATIKTKRKLKSVLISTRDNITKAEYHLKTDESVKRLRFYVDQLLSSVEKAKIPSLKDEDTQFYEVMIDNDRLSIELNTAEEITIKGSELSSMVASVDGILISIKAKKLTVTEYAKLYGLSETRIERLLNKGLFFSAEEIENGVLISELELPPDGEPYYTSYDISKGENVDCPLLPAINLSTYVVIEYDEDTKKHKCRLRNWNTQFEQSYNLTQKEVNEVRRCLNLNPNIDTSQEGNVIWVRG